MVRLIFIYIPLLILTTPAVAKIRIAIDPGHGGADRGAIQHGVHEAQVALEISQKLHQLLKKDSLFQSRLLRNRDFDLQLPTRVKKAESFRTDLFVSVHANSGGNKNIKGPEFYILSQMPPEEESLYLANRENDGDASGKRMAGEDIGNVESILFDLKKTQRILESYNLSWFMNRRMRRQWKVSQKKHMIRQGPFYVLSQNEIPAVLVEVGYLSHPGEREKLQQPGYQSQMARQIYLGLRDYAKNMDKSPSPALD